MHNKRMQIYRIDLIFCTVTARLVDREGPPIVVTAMKDPPILCLGPFCKKHILSKTFIDNEFVLLTHTFLIKSV